MIKVKLNDAIEYIKGKPNKKSNEVFRHSKFGFQTLGDPFLEADLQHILMQRNC